jgi:hypothetical protein
MLLRKMTQLGQARKSLQPLLKKLEAQVHSEESPYLREEI